ncbi:MAG TPA: hypothetical protein ENN09_07565 [Planctomycetes bacterium]|nr:hypothetical protein [Planctomycetota bacterium]
MSIPENVLYKLEGGVDETALREILAEACAAPSMAALSPWALVVVEPPFPALLFDGAVEMTTPMEVSVKGIADGAGVMIAVLSEKERPAAGEAAWSVISAVCGAARRRGLACVVFQTGDETAALNLFKAPSWYRLAAIAAIGLPGEEVGAYQLKPLETCVVLHRQGDNEPFPPAVG